MTEPIRVLQVFAQMNRGGAETMIMNFYRNIDRSKVQFDFVVHTNEKCSYDDEIKALGGNIYRIKSYDGKNHFDYKKSWSIFFKNNPQYKIIHGHMRSTASIYLKIAKKNNLKTIAHSHNTSSGNGLSALAKNILQYPIRYISDYFFACSMTAGEWLFGEKVCQNKNFYLVKNAIDSEQFIFDEEIRLSKRKEFNINDKFVIGHVGRFHPQKNHEFLIDIFKDVHINNKNAILLLIGDGEQKIKIKDKVDKYNLSDFVIFAGLRDDIPDLLQAMDIFLMPSFFEGLPVTLMEAQASGLNCMVSDTITNDVKITDLITFVSLKKSSKYWAEYIMSNLAYYTRRKTHNEIRNAGYDVKKNVRWLEEFYLTKHQKF